MKALMIGVPYELYSGSFPSTAVAMPGTRVQLTIQSIFDSASAVDIDIEASDDGTNWAVVDNFDQTAGEILTLNISPLFIRINGSATADEISVLAVAKK